jgi:hypothetical protein
MARDGSTIEELAREQRDKREVEQRQRKMRAIRRVFLAALALLVVTGLAGLYDVRLGTASTDYDGGRLIVKYPRIGRPGLPVSWSIEVDSPGGFQGDVTIGFDSTYLSSLQSPSLVPDPSSSKSAGDLVLWTFDQPSGDRLLVNIDATFESDWELKTDGLVQVIEGGRVVAQQSFTTWKLP